MRFFQLPVRGVDLSTTSRAIFSCELGNGICCVQTCKTFGVDFAQGAAGIGRSNDVELYYRTDLSPSTQLPLISRTPTTYCTWIVLHKSSESETLCNCGI